MKRSLCLTIMALTLIVFPMFAEVKRSQHQVAAINVMNQVKSPFGNRYKLDPNGSALHYYYNPGYYDVILVGWYLEPSEEFDLYALFNSPNGWDAHVANNYFLAKYPGMTVIFIQYPS